MSEYEVREPPCDWVPRFGDLVITQGDGIGVVVEYDQEHYSDLVFVYIRDWDELETDPTEWYGIDELTPLVRHCPRRGEQVQICTSEERDE